MIKLCWYMTHACIYIYICVCGHNTFTFKSRFRVFPARQKDTYRGAPIFHFDQTFHFTSLKATTLCNSAGEVSNSIGEPRAPCFWLQAQNFAETTQDCFPLAAFLTTVVLFSASQCCFSRQMLQNHQLSELGPKQTRATNEGKGGRVSAAQQFWPIGTVALISSRIGFVL